MTPQYPTCRWHRRIWESSCEVGAGARGVVRRACGAAGMWSVPQVPPTSSARIPAALHPANKSCTCFAAVIVSALHNQQVLVAALIVAQIDAAAAAHASETRARST